MAVAVALALAFAVGLFFLLFVVMTIGMTVGSFAVDVFLVCLLAIAFVAPWAYRWRRSRNSEP
jgi:hypothetical protein